METLRQQSNGALHTTVLQWAQAVTGISDHCTDWSAFGGYEKLL